VIKRNEGDASFVVIKSKRCSFPILLNSFNTKDSNKTYNLNFPGAFTIFTNNIYGWCCSHKLLTSQISVCMKTLQKQIKAISVMFSNFKKSSHLCSRLDVCRTPCPRDIHVETNPVTEQVVEVSTS
jgi:hypothetical protein